MKSLAVVVGIFVLASSPFWIYFFLYLLSQVRDNHGNKVDKKTKRKQ